MQGTRPQKKQRNIPIIFSRRHNDGTISAIRNYQKGASRKFKNTWIICKGHVHMQLNYI